MTKKKEVKIIDKDKEILVNQIKAIDDTFDKVGIDLFKFSIEELKHHLDKLRGKK